MLLYRVAHEAVRNVATHAQATRLDVSLARDNGLARLVVADNGRGFSADRLERRREEGHLGLSLLTGLLAEAGGRLVVDSTPGQGTRLEAEVPVQGASGASEATTSGFCWPTTTMSFAGGWPLFSTGPRGSPWSVPRPTARRRLPWPASTNPTLSSWISRCRGSTGSKRRAGSWRPGPSRTSSS